MDLDAWMEQTVAEAPPLTARQRDLIAACFSGVEFGAIEVQRRRVRCNRSGASSISFALDQTMLVSTATIRLRVGNRHGFRLGGLQLSYGAVVRSR
jgi:hypothetical protein